MIKTFGLTHIALAVADTQRASRFYRAVFGMVEIYHEEGFVQMQTPGTRDVLVFEQDAKRAGKVGGVAHFGFRLTNPSDLASAARAVKKAGGKILSQGDFCPGEPYLIFEDLDGYQVEIWYELPTPIDPPTRP